MMAVGRRSIRTRVTLWYTAALTAALVLYAVVVYVSLRQVLWAELDDRLHHEIETGEGLLQPYWSADGVRTPGGASPLDDDDYRWLQVWSVDGRLLFQSDIAARQVIPQLPAPGGDSAVSVSLASLGPFRVKDELGHIARHPVIVRVATSESRVRDELGEMVGLMLLTLPICALAAAYGGHHLVRRTLSSIDRLVAATTAVTAENLARRLPIENPDDEVGRIALAFNTTLSRLEASFTQMRRFTANASHELRTPLAAIRSAGQVALTDADTVGDHREAIASMLEEVDRLSALLDTLLLLARSDTGQVPLALHQVDVLDLVRGITAECRILADEKDQTITIDGTPARVAADPTVLRIAVANVVHNAIRYSPRRGRVGIRVSEAGAEAVIDVEDDGPGIPPEHVDHVFDRFYRVDPGRSSSAGGVGLGLAMARWAVTAHRGAISVRGNPAGGSTFSIVVPSDPTAPQS